ncbi:MAG: dihydroorotate dehydrogenase electron transfer subunit, partial [Bacillota bacterium]
HLKINKNNTFDPLLRRPFSFFDIDKNKGIIKLVYKIVGRGTRILSKYKNGEKINVLGPLGNGFDLKSDYDKIIVIGGGMGIVPLFMLVKLLKDKFAKFQVLLGANTGNELNFFIDRFKCENIHLSIATMDGSIGYKGTVLDLWQNLNSDAKYVYSCGPRTMLKHIKKYAENKNIPGQISLEERMGCGTGVCLSCVCQTRQGNQRVCKEGPVFPLKEVVLNE